MFLIIFPVCFTYFNFLTNSVTWVWWIQFCHSQTNHAKHGDRHTNLIENPKICLSLMDSVLPQPTNHAKHGDRHTNLIENPKICPSLMDSVLPQPNQPCLAWRQADQSYQSLQILSDFDRFSSAVKPTMLSYTASSHAFQSYQSLKGFAEFDGFMDQVCQLYCSHRFLQGILKNSERLCVW